MARTRFIAYGVVAPISVAVGIVGNLFTIILLRQPQFRGQVRGWGDPVHGGKPIPLCLNVFGDLVRCLYAYQSYYLDEGMGKYVCTIALIYISHYACASLHFIPQG